MSCALGFDVGSKLIGVAVGNRITQSARALATVAMRDGNVEQSNNRLQRAEAIIDELNNTLDMSVGDVSVRLRAIYLFCKRHLMQARRKRNPTMIDEVSGLLNTVGDAWRQIAGG